MQDTRPVRLTQAENTRRVNEIINRAESDPTKGDYYRYHGDALFNAWLRGYIQHIPGTALQLWYGECFGEGDPAQ